MIKQIITDKYHQYRLLECDMLTTDFDEVIEIDKSKHFQKFIGFGGSFTESSGYNLSRINDASRREALNAYFSKEKGLGYVLGRISIASCDFSLGEYDYVEDEDYELKSFSIKRDLKYIIPLIKEASKIAQEDIKLIASPWSPPAFMKDNKLRHYGGRILKKYYPLWAEYICLFLEQYQDNGIEIKALTVQNEPEAKQRWDSCIYSAEAELDFLKNYLAPALDKHNLNQKVYIHDHNRDNALSRVEVILGDENIPDCVAGVAVHWYDNEQFLELSKIHQRFPAMRILHTEGCIEGGPHIDEYECGERYGRNIIGDFNNYVEGFIDWNLFLDETGGPNWVNNLCSAPILTIVGSDKISYQPAYYFIGHFSKYIKVGARRIAHKNSCADLLVTTYLNPDNSVTIICLNETEIDKNIQVKGLKETFSFKSLKRSIMTIIVEEE